MRIQVGVDMKRVAGLLLTLSMFLSPVVVTAHVHTSENFGAFYAKFRHNMKFERSRTIFPLKEIVYVSTPDKSLSKADQKKYKVLIFNGEKSYPAIQHVTPWMQYTVFPAKEVMSGNEKEGTIRVSPTVYQSYIDLKNGERALTYTFHLIKGKWYLISYINLW